MSKKNEERKEHTKQNETFALFAAGIILVKKA
jgi:hypothetical protein